MAKVASKMKVTLEQAIVLESLNTPGVAGKLFKQITGDLHFDLYSLWAGVLNGKGYFWFITDNNADVIKGLQGGQYSNIEQQPCLVIHQTNGSGQQLMEITGELGSAGVNIDFIYSGEFNGKPAIFVNTVDNQKALKVLS